MYSKRYTILIILILMLGVTTAFSQDTVTKKEFTVKPGQLLVICLEAGGTLRVEGWDKNVVSVDMQILRGDPELQRIDMKKTSRGVAVTTYTRGRGRRSSGSIRVTVKVPRRFDLEFDSMGGDLILSGVEGEFEGRTMGGDLDLKDLKGQVDLETMGGDITIRDATLDGRVHTMGGRVHIEDVGGSIRGSSMGGDVTYRNRNTDGTFEAIKISTMGGDINLDEAPAGAEVKTMGGDIRVRSAKKYLQAKTMGGDIEVDALDGRIKATTMGGHIDLTMVGDPKVGEHSIELISKGGNITVYVPKDMAMDIDIVLEYTRRARRSYSITSDFDLNIKEDKEWRFNWGDARKTIHATGKTGNAAHRVSIETVNGNVTLKIKK